MLDLYDWDEYRQRFLNGESLESLARDGPPLALLRARAAAEGWKEQRKRLKRDPNQQLVDTAEMLARHARWARVLGQLGIRALEARDSTSLRPSEALQLVKLAVEIERLVEGQASSRVEIDLSKLTVEELERLARGER